MSDQEQPAKRARKAESMRDKTEKATSKRAKPRRFHRVAKATTKPFIAAHRISKRQFYLVKPRESGPKGFLTKSRRWTPSYFRSSFKELRLVTWPSRLETWRLVMAVFIFSLTFGLIITIVDFGLEKLFKKAFL